MTNGATEVVLHEGELLFLTSDGVLLDLIDSEEVELVNGSTAISIIRDGSELDKGRTFKGRMDVPAEFIGLYKIFEGKTLYAIGYQSREYLYPEYFRVGDKLQLSELTSSNYKETDYKKKYAEMMVHEKFREHYDLMFEFVNDEKFEEEYERLNKIVEQEISSFVFPKNPILRRKPRV